MATANAYASPSARDLPIGVAILAVLIAIFAILVLFAGIIIVLALGFASYAHSFSFFGLGLIGGLLLILFAVILLVVASGLWNQELWALVLSIIVVGLLWISDVLAGGFLSIGGLILLVLLIYLIAVHRHFW